MIKHCPAPTFFVVVFEPVTLKFYFVRNLSVLVALPVHLHPNSGSFLSYRLLQSILTQQATLFIDFLTSPPVLCKCSGRLIVTGLSF